MRKTEIATWETRSYFPKRDRTPENRQGSEPQKKRSHKAGKSTNDFLKEKFKPIPVHEFDPMFSETNYKFLYDSAKNYSALLGKSFSVRYRPTDFENLFFSLDKIVTENGKNHDARLFYREDKAKLYFELEYRKGCYSVCFIPCFILERVNYDLREIILTFFQHLFKTQRLEKFQNSPDYDFLYGEIDLYSEGDVSFDNEFVELAKSYMDGEVNELFKSIYAEPKYGLNELSKRIGSYRTGNDFEKKLLPVLAHGTLLFQTGRSYIMCFPVGEDEYGNYPIAPDRLIRFVYKYDCIAEWILETLNGESEGSSETFVSKGKITLTPKTKKLLKQDTFIDEFSDWLDNLLTILYEYE